MLNKEICIKCKANRKQKPNQFDLAVGWGILDEWNWKNANLVWCEEHFSSDVRCGPIEECHFYMEQLVGQ
jgi:hypothetical protein